MLEYFKKTLSVLLTNFFILFVTVLSGIIVARYLGPTGKGVLALIFIIATILKLLGGLGVEFANVYFTSRDKTSLRKIFANNIFVWISSGLMLAMVALLTKNVILYKFLPNFDEVYYNYAIIIFPFVLWLSFAQSIFQGLEKFKQFNLLKLSAPIAKLIILTVLVIILKLEMRGAILALTLSCVLAATFSFFLLSRFTSPKFPINKELLKANIKYGLKGQIGLFFQFFNYRIDMFVVNYFLGLSAVGFYSISVAIAEILWHIPNSIAATLFPRVSAKNKFSANEFTCKVNRNSISIMLLAALLLAISSIFLIPIVYGNRFSTSILPLQILLPGVIAFGLVKILTSHLQGQGKPHYGSIVTICTLVLTLIFDFLLIPKMGITGAALATTIAYVFSLILTVFFFAKETKLKLQAFLIPDFSVILSYLARMYNERTNN